MRLTLSGPVRLTLAAFVIAFMCTGNAGAATEKVLHSFNPYPHGFGPSSGLLADAAGNLYGTTFGGGANGWGTVFKLTPNLHGGWTEHVLYNFTNGADGSEPSGSLIFDQAGNLYGVTSGISTSVGSCCGTIFKLTPSGNTWKLSVLHTFNGTDGIAPNGTLVFDGAGNLYGTAGFGGNATNAPCFDAGCGTVFQLVPSSGSWTFNLLYAFTGESDGSNPNGGLIFDQAGALYGTTNQYGMASCSVYPGCGAVYKLTPTGNSWTFGVLYDFTGGADGSNPSGPLLFDSAGNLYGMASRGGSCTLLNCGVVFELTPSGGNWTESVLYAFTGGADGANPVGRLNFDQSGNLYGVADNQGGTSACGTVFQLTPSSGGWTQSVLHTFNGVSDGCDPLDVTLTASGSLVGTAFSSGPGSYGLLFELTPASGSWKESTVFAFLGTDGSEPIDSGLILDSAGSLYGTTGAGGSAGMGAVFKMTPNSQGVWTESLIYSFNNPAAGQNPRSGLVFDSQGNLYGTTSSGGRTSCPSGCGVVFKLTPSGTGWKESVIHAFSGTDGEGPLGGRLVFDAAGNLYGTTIVGGTFGYGTVFQLSPSSGGLWKETVLHNFTNGVDGGQPLGGLVFDPVGNLYGVTPVGGSSGWGIVFQLAPSSGGGWTETVLYSFTNGYDGRNPAGRLAMDAAGNLYGSDLPAVFRLSPSGGSWTLTTLFRIGALSSPPILDTVGNLYSTISNGSIDGAVFELTPGSHGWTDTILYAFTGPPLDGEGPTGDLTMDAAGNLYGNTAIGGSYNQGTVFEIVP